MAIFAALAMAAATIGGSILSSKSQSKSLDKASDQTLQATREALAVSNQRYGEYKSAISPYLVGGANAYNTLLGQYGISPSAPQPQAAPQGGYNPYASGVPQFGPTGGAPQPSAPQPGTPYPSNLPQFGTPGYNPAAWSEGYPPSDNAPGRARLRRGEPLERRGERRGEPLELPSGSNLAQGRTFSGAPAAAAPTAAPGAPTGGQGFPGGVGGIATEAGPTDLSQTPAFQIPFNVGIDRARQDLASQGLLFSGPAIQEYMDQAFGTYYGDVLGGVQNLAGAGQSAATDLGSIGQGQAGQAGNILGRGASDQANISIGQGISRGNMYSGIGKAIGPAAEALGDYWNI